MTQDPNLVLMSAVLSMNAYDEDQNYALKQIYNAINGKNIGNALIVGVPDYNQNTLFGAVEYSWNGQSIIAYRGTVSASFATVWTEAENGYGVGAGSPSGPQALEAINFYRQAVASSNSSPFGSNIVVTGHSLGGGLAGFVGALYGLNGVLFDNMPFEAAAQQAYSLSTQGEFIPNGVDGGGTYTGADIYANEFYGTAAPQSNNIANLSGYAVKGELLQPLRIAQSTPVQQLDSHSSGESATQYHSMALLVTLLWAQQNNKTSWAPIGTSLFNSFFNASEGAQITTALGEGDDASVLLESIAYTATPGGSPFGSTAISSLFHDADILGNLADSGAFTGLLAPTGQWVSARRTKLRRTPLSRSSCNMRAIKPGRRMPRVGATEARMAMGYSPRRVRRV